MYKSRTDMWNKKMIIFAYIHAICSGQKFTEIEITYRKRKKVILTGTFAY